MSQLTTEEPLDRVDFIKITNAMQHQFHKWYKFASKRQEQKKKTLHYKSWTIALYTENTFLFCNKDWKTFI